MSNENYQLLVSFDDQSHSFVHGFEAGMIWERMLKMQNNADGIIEACIHEANVPLVQRMAIQQGWAAFFNATEIEGWFDAHLARVVGSGLREKEEVAPANPRPPLRVVDGGKGDGGS